MRIHVDETGDSFFQKRLRRYDADQTPRSLTFTCYHRFPFFSKPRPRQWFIEALQKGREKFPVDLWAWVVMPEHVHLLVWPREPGKVVGPFQGYVKEMVGRKAVKWLLENAPEWIPKITVVENKRTRRRFWQAGGGFDRNLDNYKAILATINYFHENPVRRGLVEKAVDWEWSSARWYAEQKESLLEMDRSLPWLE